MRLSKALNSVMVSPPGSPGTGSAPLGKPESNRRFHILRDVPAILRKHWRMSFVVFLGVLSLITAAIFLMPRAYQSESKLFVRVGRESIGLDPTATTGQTISVHESRENEINSVIDVLKSRVILERVVEKLGHELKQPLSTSAMNETKELSSYEKDRLVRALSSEIDVSHGKKSSVITIISKARTPELAQRILQEMLESFREQHLRVNRTQGSYEFFVSQKNHLEKQLRESQTKLQDAKNQYGLASVEGERKNLEQQVNHIEQALMNNERAIVEAEAELASLKATLNGIPREIVAQQLTGFFNDANEQTREQLHQWEIEHSQLLAKFTPRHTRVQAVAQRIEAAQAILGNDRKASSQQTSTLNPAFQQLDYKRLESESRLDALRAGQDSLKQQRQRLQVALNNLNQTEIELANTQMQIDLLQSGYKTYGEKLEQARIDQELKLEDISNVNVVQAATFLPQPVSPKRRLIFALGFVFAAMSAFGYGFAKEIATGNLTFANHGVNYSDPTLN